MYPQKDFLNQQSGADIDPLQIEDVRVDHLPAFFDTMLARTYVGYGASTLGLDTASSNPQPSQHFTISGTPGSILSSGLPLPGAMMNHYVIANWYDDETNHNIASQLNLAIGEVRGAIRLITSKDYGYYLLDNKESNAANKGLT